MSDNSAYIRFLENFVSKIEYKVEPPTYDNELKDIAAIIVLVHVTGLEQPIHYRIEIEKETAEETYSQFVENIKSQTIPNLQAAPLAEMLETLIEREYADIKSTPRYRKKPDAAIAQR